MLEFPDPSIPENRHVTLDGRTIHFPTMRPDEFRINDVPHCLSMICRYNGFVRQFYSVAQHSVLVCEMAEAVHGKGDISHCALLHDASEAYLGDISRPFKKCLPDYERIEAHVQETIMQALNLPRDPAIWAEVKRFDITALHIEAEALLFHRYPWMLPPDQLWTKSREGRRLIQAGKKGLLPEEAARVMRYKLQDYGYNVSDPVGPRDHQNPWLESCR